MKCMNCSAEILPQYVHSIANNSCPGCGGQIYDDKTKELYTELKEAMIKMPNDPVGLAGWLLDNYKLIKIGAAEPVEKFYSNNIPAKKPQVKTADVQRTNDFFNRAGVSPQSKPNKNYAAIVEELNSSIENSMYGGGEEIEEEYNPSEEEYNEDLKAAKELGFISNESGIFLPGKPLKGSELKEIQEILQPTSQLKGSVQIQESILENERLVKLERQNAMLSGSGGFKR